MSGIPKLKAGMRLHRVTEWFWRGQRHGQVERGERQGSRQEKGTYYTKLGCWGEEQVICSRFLCMGSNVKLSLPSP